MPKRKDYIGWDEYFMGVALLSGERSKDPNSQVGACIVSDDNKILSIELNAILNYTGTTLKNSRVYVALFPCNECAKAIIQSGIKEVIYKSDKYADTDSVKVSKKLLDMGHVKYRQYIPTGRKIELDL